MTRTWTITDPKFLADDSKRLASFIIAYDGPTIKVLDQLQLPHQLKYIDITSVKDACEVITKMQVRGAPLIATVAVFGLCMESFQIGDKFTQEYLHCAIAQLVKTRPTAVNLKNVLDRLRNQTIGQEGVDFQKTIRAFAYQEVVDEAKANKQLCWNGVQAISCLPRKNAEGYTIMTICNTGSLATSSWGTALGVIAGLHDRAILRRVLCLETRPYNQGSRLTAMELSHLGVDYRLICDSMAASAIKEFDVDAIIVGADRVVANGDTANKIGTFNLAIVAKHFSIPFFVALPFDTFDFDTLTGDSITIENRKEDEMRYFNGSLICERNTPVFNPAFDVTTADMIAGYITERGYHTVADFPALAMEARLEARAAKANGVGENGAVDLPVNATD